MRMRMRFGMSGIHEANKKHAAKKHGETNVPNTTINSVNPYTEILASSRGKRFFGRRSIIAKIVQGVTAKDPKSFSIRGNKAIGKTILLKFLCRETDILKSEYPSLSLEYKLGENVRFVYVDLDRIVEDKEPIPYLYRKIKEALGNEEAEETAEPESKRLHNLFRSYGKRNVRLVVCLDHFDRAYKSMTHEDEYFLRHLCVHHQSLVTATEKDFLELRRIQENKVSSPLVPVLEGIIVGLLTESEARELVDGPARKAGKTFSPEIVDFLIRIAGRHPYLLPEACSHVFELFSEYGIDKFDEFQLTDNTKEHLKVSVGALTGFTSLFEVFWKDLVVSERTVLIKIAKDDRDFDRVREVPTLNTLKNRALIYDDLMSGNYYVFSELFRDFVLRRAESPSDGVNADLESMADRLPPLDRKLLRYLADRPGQVCRFEELVENIWNEKDLKKKKRGLEAAVHRIRQELANEDESGWEYIKNERGEGYRFEPKAS